MAADGFVAKWKDLLALSISVVATGVSAFAVWHGTREAERNIELREAHLQQVRKDGHTETAMSLLASAVDISKNDALTEGDLRALVAVLNGIEMMDRAEPLPPWFFDAAQQPYCAARLNVDEADRSRGYYARHEAVFERTADGVCGDI